jgi:hypothetical protein
MSCLAGIFKVIKENRKNRIHDHDPKPDSKNRYGSPDPDDPQNVMRPQHCY